MMLFYPLPSAILVVFIHLIQIGFLLFVGVAYSLLLSMSQLTRMLLCRR